MALEPLVVAPVVVDEGFNFGSARHNSSRSAAIKRALDVRLRFEVQNRRAGKGVYRIDLDDVFLHGKNLAAAQGNQIRPHRRPRREDAGERIGRISPRMNLEC